MMTEITAVLFCAISNYKVVVNDSYLGAVAMNFIALETTYLQ